MNQGDLQLAKDKLDKALTQDPNNPEVHSVRAMLFERMGQPAKADAEYRTALRLAPNDPNVINNYAVYLCQNGRTDEGVKHFLLAAKNALYRTPEAAYTNAGVCLRAAKPPRDEEARADFVKALQLRPDFSDAAYQLADLEFQHGELPQSRALLDAYLNNFRDTPDILLLAVRVARAQNDRMGAQRYARKLQTDFPGLRPDACPGRTRPQSRLNEMTREAGGVGIGARLRAARERKGQTVLQAAEKLHVDARLLEALETRELRATGGGRVRTRAPAPLRRTGRRIRGGAATALYQHKPADTPGPDAHTPRRTRSGFGTLDAPGPARGHRSCARRTSLVAAVAARCEAASAGARGDSGGADELRGRDDRRGPPSRARAEPPGRTRSERATGVGSALRSRRPDADPEVLRRKLGTDRRWPRRTHCSMGCRPLAARARSAVLRRCAWCSATPRRWPWKSTGTPHPSQVSCAVTATRMYQSTPAVRCRPRAPGRGD